ncbi:MAG: hypothetical protein HC818_01185 [Synechococcaceae cyanobacterium RM1_1_27]|nr:hypothetical protein [Synechococcaceae cyanobacterium RM1_1_27]
MKAQLFKFIQYFFVLLSLILFVGCGSGSPTSTSITPDTPLSIIGLERSEPGDPVDCSTCCRRCVTGKACGNSCININYECYQPPGCACNKVEDTCYLPTPEPTPTPDPCVDIDLSAPIPDGECSSSSPGRVSRSSGQIQDSVTINSSKLNIKFWDGGFNPYTGLPQIDGDQIKVTIKPGSLPEEVPDSRLNALTLIGPFPLGDEFSIPLKAVKNVVTITSVSSGIHPFNTVRYGIDSTQIVEGVSSRGANLITVPSTGVGINSISFEVIVKPDINEKHIFEGEIVIRGGVREAKGFHSRPDGVNPPTATIRLNSDGTSVFGRGPNSRGIYERVIDVWDPNTDEWIEKGPVSSFFPDSWSRSTVIEENLEDILGYGLTASNDTSSSQSSKFEWL